jgi:hypothetical protein
MRQPGVDRQAATGWARNHKQPLPIVDVEKSAETDAPIRLNRLETMRTLDQSR